jgi:predicted SAM-dependent methyltransferase
MTRYKYIFGAGTRPHVGEGFINVDRLNLPGIDVIHDLDTYPYPFEIGSGLHINATHVIEHLSDVPKFMDECWRILQPGGTLYLETPHAKDIALSFSDPTHKQHLTEHSFINYFTLEGVEKFGYSQFAWSILHIETVNGVIFVHLMPIPTECYQDEILRRINKLT